MEIRNAKMVVNKSGSGSSTFRATLPATWIREMGLSENVRDLKLTFDTEKIIIEKDMEELNLKKENLMKKINGLIDRKMLETGKMGTEIVSVTLELSDEEKEAFHEIELEENYGYDLDGNNLTISYSEEIEGDKNMKKLNILKSYEDGSLTLSYKGIDLNRYYYITVDEFIDVVENTNTWDEIESRVYEKALEDVGLDYNSYSDPDEMWEDFLDKANLQ